MSAVKLASKLTTMFNLIRIHSKMNWLLRLWYLNTIVIHLYFNILYQVILFYHSVEYCYELAATLYDCSMLIWFFVILLNTSNQIVLLLPVYEYLTKKTTMFTVLCRHAHSDWQITEAFLYAIGKSNIM